VSALLTALHRTTCREQEFNGLTRSCLTDDEIGNARPLFRQRAVLMTQGRKPNLARLSLIGRLRAEGRTLAEIAEQVGVSRQAIHNALRRKQKYPESTICSYCKVSRVAAAGTDSLRSVACRKCLAVRDSIPLPIRLASLRIAAQMSQLDLADATGISQSFISMLESGSHKTRPGTWERLFSFLNSALANDSKPAISRRRNRVKER
jgi:transcriptional regulator with XRE-family HTH domain